MNVTQVKIKFCYVFQMILQVEQAFVVAAAAATIIVIIVDQFKMLNEPKRAMSCQMQYKTVSR